MELFENFNGKSFMSCCEEAGVYLFVYADDDGRIECIAVYYQHHTTIFSVSPKKVLPGCRFFFYFFSFVFVYYVSTDFFYSLNLRIPAAVW